jgi:hypothetical protein
MLGRAPGKLTIGAVADAVLALSAPDQSKSADDLEHRTASPVASREESSAVPSNVDRMRRALETIQVTAKDGSGQVWVRTFLGTMSGAVACESPMAQRALLEWEELRRLALGIEVEAS